MRTTSLILAVGAVSAVKKGFDPEPPTVGIHLESKTGSGATGSIKFSSAGGLQVTASGCVDRSTWCGKYKRTDCPTSNAAVASTIKIADETGASHFVYLHEDGTLAFALSGKGCVSPVAKWSTTPDHGAELKGATSSGFVTTTANGIELLSANGFSVNGGTIEPQCKCDNGVAATDSCMAHEDSHCASCAPGFYRTGKSCTAFTVCDAGEHQTTAPVQTAQNRECKPNDAGFFTVAAGQVTAVEWKTCAVGSGATNTPSATEDRKCASCVLGTDFSNADGGLPCQTADVCDNGEYELQAATLSSDRKCKTHRLTCNEHEYETQDANGQQDRECAQKVCHCPNGVPITGKACPKHGDPACSSCIGAFHRANDNKQCDPNTCSCIHGQVAFGAACTAHGATKCTSCNGGYHVEAANCVITPIDGGWSDFSAPGACSVTACGQTGTRTMTRTCSNPAKAHGGLDCVGSATDDSTACATKACTTTTTTTTTTKCVRPSCARPQPNCRWVGMSECACGTYVCDPITTTTTTTTTPSYDGSSAFTNKVWCGANSGRINTAAHCQAAAGKQGYAFGGVGTDPKYLTGCIIEFGKAYFIPLTSTGIMGGATNEFLCDKRPGASYFSGGQCGGSGCGSGGGGIITTEQGCKNAAASYGRSFQSAAGTEWFAGCIIHGGKAYFVPLKAGHTCDKKDAHQSGSNQGYLCMN